MICQADLALAATSKNDVRNFELIGELLDR